MTAGGHGYHGQHEEVHFDMITREYGVELRSLALFCGKSSRLFDVTVEIRQVNCAEPSPPISVTARVQDPTYTVDLPASSRGCEGVVLLPNSQYRVSLGSHSGLDMYTCNGSSVSNSHLTVNHLMMDDHSSRARIARRDGLHAEIQDLYIGDALAQETFISCINYINYKTLTPK